MAAGMSTRFVPLSMEIPKALLCVKGEVLIERQICQLREAGVREIVVVVGYLKEKFNYLKEKYGVILIVNPVYKERNNHSTLYVAKEYLKNTFICSGDNYFTENVFLEQNKNAYYAAVYEVGKTSEWCLHADETGRIKNVTIGGADSWVMKGHAYFDEAFSAAICPYLSEVYQDEEKKGQFWEEIFIEHIDEMQMYIRQYTDNIIEEFDSIEELRVFDKAYEVCSGSKIMKELCEVLNCNEAELKQICPIKTGDEVSGFQFNCRGRNYKYCLKEGSLVS